jgi:hypothetical protein
MAQEIQDLTSTPPLPRCACCACCADHSMVQEVKDAAISPVPFPSCCACCADRSMVQEIKDAAEKKRQERGAVLQAVSGRADFAARLQPHLTFDFSDMWVLLLVVVMGRDAAEVWHALGLQPAFGLRGDAPELRHALGLQHAVMGFVCGAAARHVHSVRHCIRHPCSEMVFFKWQAVACRYVSLAG